MVSLSVRTPHTPSPHPKNQSCARGPAGPTKVAKSSIDGGATRRNRPFWPFWLFPCLFLVSKTSMCGFEPHLPPPVYPHLPPKRGSKRRLPLSKRRLLGGKCGSKSRIFLYITVVSLSGAAHTYPIPPQKIKIAYGARRAKPRWSKVRLVVGQQLATHRFGHFARFHGFFWSAWGY